MAEDNDGPVALLPAGFQPLLHQRRADPRFWSSGKTAIGARASAGTVPALVMIGKSLKRMWPTIWPACSATSDSRT
jgi:hypothetical protein